MCINYSRLKPQVQKYHKATSGGRKRGGGGRNTFNWICCVFFCVLCFDFCFTVLCERTQMSKSNQKCTKFMAFLWLRHKFIIILFEPGSSVATHTHSSSHKRFRQPFCLCVREQINKSQKEGEARRRWREKGVKSS